MEDVTNNGHNPQVEAGNRVYTHYLVNFTGQGEPVPASAVAFELGKAMAAAGVDLLMATTYASPLGVNPQEIGLKDNWDKVSEADREELLLRFPELCFCLDLLAQRGVS